MLDRFREKRSLRLVTALVVGLLFGFLLQKGGATDYGVLVNQLLLRDFTVLKIIFSAIVVGSLGIHLLVRGGLVDPSIKPFKPKPIIIGGLIFGAGFALLGYCPGTLAGAIGAGSIHALLGAVGMVTGSSAFANLYPRIKGSIEEGNRGRLTIPEVLKVDVGLALLIVDLLLIIMLILIEISSL
ncbi:MAG: YeeE/YedE thiosulfate transporter family protein [Candidatus Bipolaricaulota bacterium]|nr:YeeE/YedE family protein [Candidatus Bipolaricaulota bacterium]MBS3792046.1 YeeE/YedE family protein [Candidatus Bipolaricaulota bacterium]